MVLVAKSQLGYTESKADVDEDGNGYTMYADQYYKDKPMVYADWDCTFVAYCLYHAGVPQDIIPSTPASAPCVALWPDELGLLRR